MKIFIFSFLISSALAIFANAEERKLKYLHAHNGGVKPMLTVEETIGAIFDSRNIRNVGQYIRANKKSEMKVILRKLLKKDEFAVYWCKMIRFLGYIGDESDVKLIENMLLAKPTKFISRYQQETVFAIFASLGNLSKRGASDVSELLKLMLWPDYWDKVITFRYKEVGSARHSPLTTCRIYALYAYYKIDKEDASKQAAKMLATFEPRDDVEKNFMSNVLSEKGINDAFPYNITAEQQPLTVPVIEGLNNGYSKISHQLQKDNDIMESIKKAKLEKINEDEIKALTLEPLGTFDPNAPYVGYEGFSVYPGAPKITPKIAPTKKSKSIFEKFYQTIVGITSLILLLIIAAFYFKRTHNAK